MGACFWRGKTMSAPFLFVWIVEPAQSGNIDVSCRHPFITMVQPAANRKRDQMDGPIHHPGFFGRNGGVAAQSLVRPPGVIVLLNVFSE